MRKLLSSEYIPFGTQYYRAPSPQPTEWEKDLRNIARQGFNMVKFWVQWRWNNPKEGVFYFEDIDRLMDLAQKYKLRVMLNTIFDVAPAWIYRKYHDAPMVTLDGRKIGPQTQPHRQIGGLGLCLNHQQAMVYFFDFLRQTVRRYKDHPALEIWNVGSEPELTQSMSEIRLYADDASKMGDMLCYCPNCRFAFRKWLNEKYGLIDKLNESWNRNYITFDDIEVPRTRNTFNDMIDWRMFFVYTLGQNVKRRFEVAAEEDSGKHPLMCHHVFIQGFPVTSTASDPWNVGQYGDLHAFTQMDDPTMPDILRSCAKGKPVISAEMLMLFGYTLDLPKPITLNDIKRFIFTGVAANLKGFIFWQYRPEILGREAPTWGLSYLDGSETPCLKSFAQVNKVIQKNATFLLEAAPRTPEVAILYNPENQVFAWASTGNEKNATNSLLGTHKALYERNYTVDFVHPREFEHDILSNYKVLYIPFPYCLSENICEAIREWVRHGGVLIAESYFGGWNIEHGHHATNVPGYGFQEVFHACQRVVAPPDADGRVRIKMTVQLPGLNEGTEIYGALVRETFSENGGKVLARFATGEPAITSAKYGDGKAILIGSYVGLPYQLHGYTANADLITGLVEYCLPVERPQLKNGSRVRVDVLAAPKRQMMIIVRNLEDHPAEDTIMLPAKGVKELEEQFNGEKVSTRREQGRLAFDVALAPQEVRVYRA